MEENEAADESAAAAGRRPIGPHPRPGSARSKAPIFLAPYFAPSADDPA